MPSFLKSTKSLSVILICTTTILLFKGQLVGVYARRASTTAVRNPLLSTSTSVNTTPYGSFESGPAHEDTKKKRDAAKKKWKQVFAKWRQNSVLLDHPDNQSEVSRNSFADVVPRKMAEKRQENLTDVIVYKLVGNFRKEIITGNHLSGTFDRLMFDSKRYFLHDRNLVEKYLNRNIELISLISVVDRDATNPLSHSRKICNAIRIDFSKQKNKYGRSGEHASKVLGFDSQIHTTWGSANDVILDLNELMQTNDSDSDEYVDSDDVIGSPTADETEDPNQQKFDSLPNHTYYAADGTPHQTHFDSKVTEGKSKTAANNSLIIKLTNDTVLDAAEVSEWLGRTIGEKGNRGIDLERDCLLQSDTSLVDQHYNSKILVDNRSGDDTYIVRVRHRDNANNRTGLVRILIALAFTAVVLFGVWIAKNAGR